MYIIYVQVRVYKYISIKHYFGIVIGLFVHVLSPLFKIHWKKSKILCAIGMSHEDDE